MQKDDTNIAHLIKKIDFLMEQMRTRGELQFTGFYKTAMQEYVEALSYYGFIKSKKLPAISSLKVNEEDYLMGICDLTGELARKAVTIAHKEDKDVEKIKEFVEELFVAISNSHFCNTSNVRNFSLRALFIVEQSCYVK